jgi:PAS domain S-box-containing protein
MAQPASSRSSIIVVLALAGLIGCLAFSAIRLLKADGSVRIRGENTFWMLTQAQYEAAQFSKALAVSAAGKVPKTEDESVSHRYVVLLSRVNILLEGPQARELEAIGDLGTVRRSYDALLAAEASVESGLAPPAALELEETVNALTRSLRSLANSHVLASRLQAIAERDQYVRSIFEGMAAVFGILASATLLAWRLLDGTRRTQRAEKLLQQEQAFSDLVINLSNQGILILDESRNVLLWNPGMEALFGLRPDEAIGHPIESCVPLFRTPALQDALDLGSQGVSRTVDAETEVGGVRNGCVEISSHPLTMSERRLVIVFVRDVTERWIARKRTELQNVQLESEVKERTVALHQAKDRLVAAINTASEGFAAFDDDGRLLIANERIRQMEPVASCYRDGMTLREFLECFVLCEGADARLLRSGVLNDPIELDLQIGAENWAHLAVTRAEGGTIFVRLSDVTPYKKAALALQSALDRERETTNAYRSFVSMVSHQFRTPIAIVDSSAQRILRRGAEATPDELATRATKIRKAMARLTRLVDSVLNAARIDSGQIEIVHAPCDLVRLVTDVCEYQREISPGFEISLMTPAEPVEFACDAMLIEQVLVNLLSNAVKYSGNASLVAVRLWTEGGMVKCSVRDWGIGIPAEEVPNVFRRFYRARTAAGIAGTGIGLNVAQEIVRMHGGDIEVESREGQGSTFTLSIPLTAALAARQAA